MTSKASNGCEAMQSVWKEIRRLESLARDYYFKGSPADGDKHLEKAKKLRRLLRRSSK